MATWKLNWLAPQLAMVTKPLELSFEKIGTPPARVRIEIWESDAAQHEVDDYENKLKKKEKSDNDDLIAKFEGTIEPREPKGGLFKVDKGGPQLKKDQANDFVVIKFEGNSKKFECGVPFDPDKEPVDGDSDGAFYEIYAQVFDAAAPEGSKPIVTTDVHLVRRRTDLLLKIEPLNQCDGSLGGGMGAMVFKYFHDGNDATRNRQWGDIILGTNNGNPTAKTLCKSGCNYAVLCQALRYFRRSKPTPEGEVPPAEKKWISIFDEVIEADLDDAFKPYTRLEGWSRFPITDNEISAAAAKVGAAQKWKKNKATLEIDGWKNVPAGATRDAMKAVRKKTETIKKHWWLAKLVWWVRKLESGGAASPPDDDDTPQTSTTSWKGINSETGEEETVPALLPDGSPLVAQRFKGTMKWSFVSSDGRVMPPYSSGLAEKLKIKGTAINHGSEKFKEWDKHLKKHLDRGLPAIAHIKSGRYLKPGEDGGGHYVLVVGYRKTNGVLRFIVNDSAGMKKLQYETFRESDVSPSEVTKGRQFPSALKVRFVVSRDGVELGKGEAVFADEDELAGALSGTFPVRKIDLTGAGAGTSVKVVFEGGTSPPKTQNYDTFRYSVEVSEGGTPALTAAHVQTKCKKKTVKKNKEWSGSGAASHAEGPLEVDLTFEGTVEKKAGLRGPRPWEGLHDVLVGRRRFDSLFALHLLEPRFKMEEGAAQWLVFDGKVKTEEKKPAGGEDAGEDAA